MTLARETPLSGVPGWLPEYVRKLEESWITTAEQVVAIAETPNGVTTLAARLGVRQPEIERLLDQARAALPSDVALDLKKPVDTSQFGLGARLNHVKTKLPKVKPPR